MDFAWSLLLRNASFYGCWHYMCTQFQKWKQAPFSDRSFISWIDHWLLRSTSCSQRAGVARSKCDTINNVYSVTQRFALHHVHVIGVHTGRLGYSKYTIVQSSPKILTKTFPHYQKVPCAILGTEGSMSDPWLSKRAMEFPAVKCFKPFRPANTTTQGDPTPP